MTDYPDGTLPITISGITIAVLPVDITAQTIGNIAIDIAGQSVGNININLAASDITVDVNITSSVQLDINIAASAVTLDINIASSAVTLDITVTDPALRVGMADSAICFDGTDDVVLVPDDDTLDVTSTCTIEAWIYPHGWGGGTSGRIVDKNYAAAYSFMVRDYHDGLTFTAAGGVYDSEADCISLRTLQHVVVTFDSGLGSDNVKFYVNAVAKGVATRTSAIPATTDDLRIGNAPAGNRCFDGLIANLRIYNRVLSPTEIAENYANPNAPCLRGLVLWIPFNEGAGTTANDKSGNGNNGTITGAIWSSLYGEVSTVLNVNITAQAIGNISIDIAAQTVGNITVDIAAQTVGNITVDIAAQTVGNIAIDIAAQTVGNIDINIAASAISINVQTAVGESVDTNVISSITLDVDITAQSVGNISIDIAAQTVGNIDINIAAAAISLNIKTDTGEHVDTDIVSSITLDVDITAQSVGNISIDIAAQTVGNIDVDIAAQTVDLNIKTSGGVNIIIDKLTQTAYTMRADTIANDNGVTTPTAPPSNLTADAYEGKFFPRGMRGVLRGLYLYCKRTGAGTVTLAYSPQPQMGEFGTVTLTPAAAWNWVEGTIDKMWNYDSLFVWIKTISADVSYGYDGTTPYDGWTSADSGATWVPMARRYFIRAYISGMTVGDIPISGTVNTVEIPNVAAVQQEWSSGVAAGGTSYVQFAGTGKVLYVIFAARDDNARDDLQPRILVDGTNVFPFASDFADINTNWLDNGQGVKVRIVKWDTTNHIYAIECSIEVAYKRLLQVGYYNAGAALRTGYASIVYEKLA